MDASLAERSLGQLFGTLFAVNKKPE